MYLPERLIRLILLHEERKVRMLICAVVEHVLEIGHDVLVLEEVALVLGLLKICEHLLDDLALTPLDISVFCVCIFSAHKSVPIRCLLALTALFLYNSCIN